MRPSQQGPSVCLCVRACVCCVEGVTGGAFAVLHASFSNASNSDSRATKLGQIRPRFSRAESRPFPECMTGLRGK